MSRLPKTIWIDVTGRYCRGGIDQFWHFSYAAANTSDKWWFALHRELRPHAYQWAYEPLGNTSGVYLNSPFDNRGWRYAVHSLPVGVTANMAKTHPFVSFHYETGR